MLKTAIRDFDTIRADIRAITPEPLVTEHLDAIVLADLAHQVERLACAKTDEALRTSGAALVQFSAEYIGRLRAAPANAALRREIERAFSPYIAPMRRATTTEDFQAAYKAFCREFVNLAKTPPAASTGHDNASEGLHREIRALRQRVAQLEAASLAYASEFPPNADGDPDVANIHANIRKLKAGLGDTPQ